MNTRLGRVTNLYPDGRLRVEFEDEKNTSMPLPVLTFNREYTLPQVGDRVVTMHLENGSSKGFILGTYFSGGGLQSKADHGYRKDFENYDENGTYVIVEDHKYEHHGFVETTFFLDEKEYLKIEPDKVTISIAGTPVITVEAGKVTVDGVINATGTITSDANVRAGGGSVTLQTHTHTGVHGETSTAHG